MVENTPLGKWSGRRRTNLRLVLSSPRDKLNTRRRLLFARRSHAGSESRELCGNRCGKEVFSGLRIGWAGGPETSRRGSAIRHEREGVGTITGVAVRDEMHRGGHGKHGFLLETGVQRFRRK